MKLYFVITEVFEPALTIDLKSSDSETKCLMFEPQRGYQFQLNTLDSSC